MPELLHQTETEKLLVTTPPELVEVDDVATISFPDSLLLAQVVAVDIDSTEHQRINRTFVVPTRPLDQAIARHPYASNVDPNGLDYSRAIGQEVFDEVAQNKGYGSFLDIRIQTPERLGENGDMESYWQLYDGYLTFITDPQYERDPPPGLWRDIIDQFGSGDDGVEAYFAVVEASLRIDAQKLLQRLHPGNSLPHPNADLELLQKRQRVGQAMATYLAERGYEPDRPDWFAHTVE